MDITAEEIIELIQGEITTLSLNMDIDRAKLGMFDGTQPLNNVEYAEVDKIYHSLRSAHNTQLALQKMLNLIQAADETKHNGGAI